MHYTYCFGALLKIGVARRLACAGNLQRFQALWLQLCNLHRPSHCPHPLTVVLRFLDGSQLGTAVAAHKRESLIRHGGG